MTVRTMRKIFSHVMLWAVFVLTALLSAGGEAAAQSGMEENRAYFPPVLMYHDVRETALNYFDVTVEDFRAQLDRLQAEGYETLSMGDFVAIVKSGKEFPKNAVLITFDDGYRGIYEYAAPELQKRGMKATFFIIADLVGKTDETYPYVTTTELRALAANSLFSIGSHTLTHPHLDQLDAAERQKEIAKSRKDLEKLAGRRVEAIAFPYGAYDKNVIRDVQTAGYAISFAVQDRGLLHEPARYSIPRIYMGLEMGRENLDGFSEYVGRYREMPAALFVERWEPLKNE